MVQVFTPTNEEWNQGIIGLKDYRGENVKFNDIVMLMGEEYGMYMIVCNEDDVYGASLTDDITCKDKESRIHFNEFLNYEDIKIIGTFDPKNKIMAGKIGTSEKCMSYLSKKRNKKAS